MGKNDGDDKNNKSKDEDDNKSQNEDGNEPKKRQARDPEGAPNPNGRRKIGSKGLRWTLALAALGGLGVLGYMALNEDEGEWIDPFAGKKKQGASNSEPRQLKVLDKKVSESSRFYSFTFLNIKTGEESKVNFLRPDWQIEDILKNMKIGKTYEVVAAGGYVTVKEIDRKQPDLKVIKGSKGGDAPKPPKR